MTTIAERVAARFKEAVGFKVQRLESETVLESVSLESGRTIGFKSPKGITFAVVDQQGRVVKTKNALTQRDQYEIYPQKNTAQKVADYLNKSGKAARFKEARRLPVVYIPSQTNVGFSVFVPTPHDADDLARVLTRARLGRARIRTQKSYILDAVELHWVPTGTMPSLHDFERVVEQWSRHKGYGLARDMRELRRGLESLRA